MALLPYANAPGGNSISLSAGSSSQNISNVVFSNSKGVSFGLNASSITASVSNQSLSLYAVGNTTQNSSTQLNASNLSFNALGNVSV